MLALSSGPRRAFADGTFLAFLGISTINDLFAPAREVRPLRWVAFSFPEGAIYPDPSGGARGP